MAQEAGGAVHEGWVMKRSRTVRSWRARWLSLLPDGRESLEASTSLRGPVVTEAFVLQDVASVQVVDDARFGRSNCFLLLIDPSQPQDTKWSARSSRQREVAFQVSSPSESAAWVDAIRGALAVLRSGTKPGTCENASHASNSARSSSVANGGGVFGKGSGQTPPPVPSPKGATKGSPPPPPPPKGLAKGSKGNVPNIPKLALGGKGCGVPPAADRAAASAASRAPLGRRTSLKDVGELSQSACTARGSRTIFDRLYEVREDKLKGDVEALAEVFRARSPRTASKTSTASGSRPGSRQSSIGKHVLSDKAAQNIAIVMASLPLKGPSLVQALEHLEPGPLEHDQVGRLLDALPPDDQLRKLASEDVPEVDLRDIERALLPLARMPQLRQRVQALSIAAKLGPQQEAFMQDMQTVRAACEELKASAMLRAILSTALVIYNYVNFGITYAEKERARAFDIVTITRLSEFKTSHGLFSNFHGLHFVVMRLLTENPKLTVQNLVADVSHVQAATRVLLTTISKGIEALSVDVGFLKSTSDTASAPLVSAAAAALASHWQKKPRSPVAEGRESESESSSDEEEESGDDEEVVRSFAPVLASARREYVVASVGPTQERDKDEETSVADAAIAVGKVPEGFIQGDAQCSPRPLNTLGALPEGLSPLKVGPRRHKAFLRRLRCFARVVFLGPQGNIRRAMCGPRPPCSFWQAAAEDRSLLPWGGWLWFASTASSPRRWRHVWVELSVPGVVLYGDVDAEACHVVVSGAHISNLEPQEAGVTCEQPELGGPAATGPHPRSVFEHHPPGRASVLWGASTPEEGQRWHSALASATQYPGVGFLWVRRRSRGWVRRWAFLAREPDGMYLLWFRTPGEFLHGEAPVGGVRLDGEVLLQPCAGAVRVGRRTRSCQLHTFEIRCGGTRSRRLAVLCVETEEAMHRLIAELRRIVDGIGRTLASTLGPLPSSPCRPLITGAHEPEISEEVAHAASASGSPAKGLAATSSRHVLTPVPNLPEMSTTCDVSGLALSSIDWDGSTTIDSSRSLMTLAAGDTTVATTGCCSPRQISSGHTTSRTLDGHASLPNLAEASALLLRNELNTTSDCCRDLLKFFGQTVPQSSDVLSDQVHVVFSSIDKLFKTLSSSLVDVSKHRQGCLQRGMPDPVTGFSPRDCGALNFSINARGSRVRRGSMPTQEVDVTPRNAQMNRRKSWPNSALRSSLPEHMQ